MQSTGHTSTHERSLTLTHGSAITYGIYILRKRLSEYAKVDGTLPGSIQTGATTPLRMLVKIPSGILTACLEQQDTGELGTDRYHRYLWVPSEHAAERKRAPCCSRPVCGCSRSAASTVPHSTTSLTPPASPRERCTAS